MKVIIFDESFVPGLGKGPFLEPIEIAQDKYFLYKRMGLRIFDVSKKVSIVETGVKNRQKRTENFSEATNDERKIINSVSNTNLEVKETPKKGSKPVIEETVEISTEVENTETEAEIEEILKEAEETEVVNELDEDVIAETTETEEIQDSDNEVEEESEDISEEDDMSVEDYLRSLTKKQIVAYCDENDIEYSNKTDLLKLNKEELIDFVLSNM